MYVYTDVPSVKADLTVEKTPLHSLHNATVMHGNCNAMTAPSTTVISTDKHLTMLFEGSTVQQRLKLRILMDTGASANFVSPRILKDLKMTFLLEAGAKLRLVDNSETAILGKVTLKLSMQHFTAVVPCYVTDLRHDFDVILGNTFLTGNRAVLDFERHTVSLTRDGKLYQLKAGSAETKTEHNDAFDEFHGDRQFLNCAQATRCIRNGCESYLVVVNNLQTETGVNSGTQTDGSGVVRQTETGLADAI